MQRKVHELLTLMNSHVFPQVETGASIKTALSRLQALNAGALLVMNSNEMIGIFSERDFARASISKSGTLKIESKVDTIMSKEVACVTRDYRLDECLAIMFKKNIRHLPILDAGKPVALLSMKHIMEAVIGDKDFLIQEMTRFVTGSHYLDSNSQHLEAINRNEIQVI